MNKDEMQANGDKSAADSSSAPQQGGANGETTYTAEQIEALQAQIVQFRDGWQRERAEFANFKRRIERETRDTYQNASADVLTAMLPVLDDFDRALANAPEDLSSHPWLAGVSAIQRKFVKVLEDFGVMPLDPTGAVFDPNLHQAIGTEDVDGVPSGQVTKVELRGYIVGDRVLRPALVRVSR